MKSTIAFSLLVIAVTAAPSPLGSGKDVGARRPPSGWIPTNLGFMCLSDYYANDEACDSFRQCCRKICSRRGKGFQADCGAENRDLRCVCDGSEIPNSGSGNGDDETTTTTTTTPTPKPSGGDEGGCGVPAIRPASRIVGGSQAIPHSWPWQISLQYTGSHICGGSLISSRHVLTAAHCVEMSSTPSSYQVVAGMHDKEKKDGTTVDVSEIHIHPSRNEGKNSNDAAVLVLAKPVSFSKNVSPICLPDEDVSDDTSCVTTGWGDTKGTGDNRYLLQVQVPILSRATCNDRDHYNGKIDNTMICAGITDKDSCQGDSGGPLVCKRSGGVWELQGITSWGHGCAQPNKPGVYSHVVVMKEWIKKIMEG